MESTKVESRNLIEKTILSTIDNLNLMQRWNGYYASYYYTEKGNANCFPSKHLADIVFQYIDKAVELRFCGKHYSDWPTMFRRRQEIQKYISKKVLADLRDKGLY